MLCLWEKNLLFNEKWDIQAQNEICLMKCEKAHDVWILISFMFSSLLSHILSETNLIFSFYHTFNLHKIKVKKFLSNFFFIHLKIV